MIKLLIADDEPLVQIGIKSMLNWSELGIEVCGVAMNGAQALKMIEEFSPEIVITDIRMPIMNGLELAKVCQERFGGLPAFIILTSYEEFALVKEAISYQVVDYLVKLELDADSLRESVNRCLSRVRERMEHETYQKQGRPLLQNYYDKFFMRLLHNLFDSEEQFMLQAKDLNLSFDDGCYVATHCKIHEEQQNGMSREKLLNLYNSSIQMAREILGKYIPCYFISLDMKHFSAVFHYPGREDQDESRLLEALNNAFGMVHKYFNVFLTVGIGTAVHAPLFISDSYQEARQAFSLTSRQSPILSFGQVTGESLKNAFNLSLFKKHITRAFEEFDSDVLYEKIGRAHV